MGALFKAAFSIVLLGLLLYRTPLSSVAASLSTLSLGAALAAFAITVAGWFVFAWRLALLAPEFGAGPVVRATLVGLYYSTVLPGQVPGDLVKAYRLSAFQNEPGRAAAVVLVDRVIAVAALFAVGAVAAAWLPGTPRLFAWPLTAGAVVLTLAVVAATSPSWTRVIARIAAWPRLRSAGTLLGRLATGLQTVRRHPWGLAANVVVAVGCHGIGVAVHVILGASLGIDLSLAAWTMVYACVSLLLVLPLSIAGVGLREGGYVGLLALFGVPASQALSLSFAFLALTLAGSLAGFIADLPDRKRAG